MINREEFNRALRTSIIILALALFILGFLWINYLYGRFNLETENFRQDTETSIQSELSEKVQVVVRQADLLYEEEAKALEDVLINRMNVIKNNLFDYADLPNELLGYRLIDDGRQFYLNTGIQETITSPKHHLFIGGEINPTAYQVHEFERIDDFLYYSEYSAPARAEIQLQVNSKHYLQEKLQKWIRAYMELEPNLLLMDPSGQSLDGISLSEEFRNEHYLSLETSNISGYTFGYYRPKAELQALLTQRRDGFQSILNNHVIEIAAFLALFVITLAIFFGMLARQHNRQLAGLNDEIIKRYRDPDSTDGELYREYGLSRAIDSLVADSKKNQQYIDMMERKHLKELKQAKIELLQLELRYEYQLNKDQTEHFTRFTPLQEDVKLHELIMKAHAEFDRSANLHMIGNDDIIQSDPAILQVLVESFFRLSDHPTRQYHVEYLIEKGFVRLLLSLENSGELEPKDIEKMRYLAGFLGEVVTRMNQDEEKFSFVLRISQE